MSIPQLVILNAVQSRLALIKVSNGYSCNVSKVKRATLKPFGEDDLPMINYWPEVDDQVLKGHGWVDRSLSIVIEFYDRTRDRVFTDVALELANDVAVAMLRSPTAPLVSSNPDINMGGLIRSSQLLTMTPQIGEGQSPWCGVVLNYTLEYRVSASNPLVMLP
jgi:hypothetical protein